MSEWKTHRSVIVPTKVLMRLREESASPEQFKALVDEWVSRQDNPTMGGCGELSIKYRVILKEDADVEREERNSSE
jgi:hypothetical protein